MVNLQVLVLYFITVLHEQQLKDFLNGNTDFVTSQLLTRD